MYWEYGVRVKRGDRPSGSPEWLGTPGHGTLARRLLAGVPERRPRGVQAYYLGCSLTGIVSPNMSPA